MNLTAHLKSRYLDLALHRPLLDEEGGYATFLLYNLSGQLVGYQQYNPLGDKKVFNSKLEGKYYTYRNKNFATVAVWGLESYYANRHGPVFLTEGVFDACRMTKVGQTAFATLANNPPKDYRNWLRMLNRPVVVVCDNDAAGRKLAKFGDYVEVAPNGEDLGNAPDDYVKYLVGKYCGPVG
jgi:hypothetical protein